MEAGGASRTLLLRAGRMGRNTGAKRQLVYVVMGSLKTVSPMLIEKIK